MTTAALDTPLFDIPDSPPPTPGEATSNPEQTSESPPDGDAQASSKQRRGPFRDRSIAGRKNDDYVFSPKESAFYTEEILEIRSQPMQRAFAKSFQRSALALFETDLIIPIIAASDEQAVAVFKAADATLSKLSKWVNDEIARISKLMADNGVVRRGDFSSPQKVELRVYSPRLYPLIDLFKALDEMVGLKSAWWFSGHMDELAYKRATYEARVKMMRVARELWVIHTGAIKALHTARRKAIDEANEEREERARGLATARAKRADMVLEKIQARESGESDADRADPLGQEELETEMGTTLDEAEAAIDAPAPKRKARKAKSA